MVFYVYSNGYPFDYRGGNYIKGWGVKTLFLNHIHASRLDHPDYALLLGYLAPNRKRPVIM